MSEIKQPNKNWINDHNFNKDLTFKIMEKKKYRKTNVPFSCQQPWLLGSSIPCRDSSSSLRRQILPRRVVLVESSSSSHRLVESSSSSQLHRVILVESSPRWVVVVESTVSQRVILVELWCLIESSSQSYRVLVESWSENRVVRVECWSTAWKFECRFIYFWASVERWLRSQKRWVIHRVTQI